MINSQRVYQALDYKIYSFYTDKNMIKAREYLKNKAELQEIECTICNQVFQRMGKCKGPCQKLICLPCITRLVCGTVGKCPLRCCDKFQFSVISFDKLCFQCPFKAEGCNFQTNKEKILKNHALACQKKSQKFKQMMVRKAKYQCPKGHLLNGFNYIYFSQYFGNQLGSFFGQKCAECTRITFTHSVCMTCTQQTSTLTFFCPECSIIPGTKQLCPHGDQLQKINLEEYYGYDWVCDYCGLAALMNGKEAYFEPNCNFGFCQDCYESVSEAHELIPMEWEYNMSNLNLEN